MTYKLRFIVKNKHRCTVSGAEYENLLTIDAECPELEAALNVGGMGENGYHVAELVGVELREPEVSENVQGQRAGADQKETQPND